MSQPSSGITLKEMARRLGLTPRSVSQALRSESGGTTRVAPDTIARVRALAQQGGYRLNVSARALRTRRFRQAGMLVRYDFKNMRIPMTETPAIFGLGDYLNGKGWHLVIVQDHDSTPDRGKVPHYVREHSLDGLVLSSHERDEDERRAVELAESGVPYIWFNNNLPTNCVGIQDDVGAELATQHLVELGHRRIIFLGVPTPHSSLAAREQGYRNVMKSYGLEPMTWIFKNMWKAENNALERQAVRVAQLREVIDDMIPNCRPTGIVCYSDTEALTVNRALLNAGYSIPRDISVVGNNDIPLVDNIYPPLTTVRTDFHLLGQMAGEMLMELLQSPEQSLKSRFLCPQLIVRNSSGPVPRSAI